MAGGLLGRLFSGVLGGRERSERPPPPKPEDYGRETAERLDAARSRLKETIAPPEDSAHTTDR